MGGLIRGWRDGKPVVCGWEIRYREAWDETTNPVIGITEGGVTGYEAWYVDHLIDCGLFDDPENKPICANAGGSGWPRLDIDGAGFRAILRLFLSKREDFEVTT
jgi:hypothetical protein